MTVAAPFDPLALLPMTLPLIAITAFSLSPIAALQNAPPDRAGAEAHAEAHHVDGWSYVVPALGARMRCPGPVAVPLSDALPEGIDCAPELAGTGLSFGTLRYGDPDSTRVAVGLRTGPRPQAAELYVDLNRDLVLSIDELVSPPERAAEPSPGVAAGKAQTWEVSLGCEVRDPSGETQFLPRRVQFQLGATGTIFSVATLGWLEGALRVGDDLVPSRRRDSGANGRFSDSSDQLWLDRNGGGQWAPMAELYLLRPVMRFDEDRYALKSSPSGDTLRLEPLIGSGLVRLVAGAASGDARADVQEAKVLFVGRDGAAFLAELPGPPTEVPIGDYRPTMLTLRLKDPSAGAPWNYVFSEAYAPTAERWRTVENGEAVDFDLTREMDFEIARAGDNGSAKRSGLLRTQVHLHTADRLLVTTCYRGTTSPQFSSGGLEADIRLADEQGSVYGQTSSGFA